MEASEPVGHGLSGFGPARGGRLGGRLVILPTPTDAHGAPLSTSLGRYAARQDRARHVPRVSPRVSTGLLPERSGDSEGLDDHVEPGRCELSPTLGRDHRLDAEPDRADRVDQVVHGLGDGLGLRECPQQPALGRLVEVAGDRSPVALLVDRRGSPRCAPAGRSSWPRRSRSADPGRGRPGSVRPGPCAAARARTRRADPGRAGSPRRTADTRGSDRSGVRRPTARTTRGPSRPAGPVWPGRLHPRPGRRRARRCRSARPVPSGPSAGPCSAAPRSPAPRSAPGRPARPAGVDRQRLTSELRTLRRAGFSAGRDRAARSSVGPSTGTVLPSLGGRRTSTGPSCQASRVSNPTIRGESISRWS